MTAVDAVVVGSGPNGLTAAVTLARAGLSVEVYEAADGIGGGARTEELTLPGFRHDPCSAVHPLGLGSPAFKNMPLAEHGLRWLQPDFALAHPFADRPAVLLDRGFRTTMPTLRRDGQRYRRLLRPFADNWDALADGILRAPLDGFPRHLPLLAGFGPPAALPVAALAKFFREPATRAMLAGLAGHAITPLTTPATGGVALMFAAAAHAGGWPIPAGGSQSISDALAGYLASLGGKIHTGTLVRSLEDLPSAKAYVLDVSPRDLARIGGRSLSRGYLAALRRYAYGPAVYKIDYALSEPVPWRDPACRRAGTVHIGPTLPDIAEALRLVQHGRPPRRPFLITSQPTVLDPSRAPDGKSVFWVYAHVPAGWPGDLTEAIERQIEDFAPGFRDIVLARSVRRPADVAAANRNYVNGDISCGAFSGTQLLLRPVPLPVPYATPDPRIFLCSAATPPGPGVHGMCGFHAARTALRRVFGA
ncbi:phytoene desaturase family protein [Fodinicola acaciae]|uniref:phytoene desaturase family protein n=1 Tax=Fodinicola acaciae TaxID=2681555 RepID=UPI0013D53A67|nr:NAD(P)/FAD-dependent oxidoreductase [Fodinicola acaciae]